MSLLRVCSPSSFRVKCFLTSTSSGLNILSTYIGSPNAVTTLSGTSMASPHTAGLLAYLLSIYPSEQFNPAVEDSDLLVDPITLLQSQRTLSSNVYAVAHAALPRWVSVFMPSPRLVDIVNAPVPDKPKTLSPAQLKKALIALSSKGLLAELPPQTVNLLAFNNATTA